MPRGLRATALQRVHECPPRQAAGTGRRQVEYLTAPRHWLTLGPKRRARWAYPTGSRAARRDRGHADQRVQRTDQQPDKRSAGHPLGRLNYRSLRGATAGDRRTAHGRAPCLPARRGPPGVPTTPEGPLLVALASSLARGAPPGKG